MRDFRPQGLGGVFDGFLKVMFNRDALLLAGIYAALSVPALCVLFRGVTRAFVDFFTSLLGQNAQGLSDNPLLADFEPSPWLVIGLIVYYIFIFLLFNLMSCALFGARYFGTPCRLVVSFRAQIKKVPGHLLFLFFQGVYYVIVYIILSLITGVVSMLAMALGQTALIVVMIIFFLLVFVALFVAADVFIFGVIPAYAIDRQGLFRSIQHSLILSVKNYFRLWGACSLFRIILLIGTLLFTFGFSQGMTALASALGASSSQLATVMMLNMLGYIVLIVLPGQIAGNAFQTVLYCNQKIRHEGLGAEFLARRFLEENSEEGEADRT